MLFLHQGKSRLQVGKGVTQTLTAALPTFLNFHCGMVWNVAEACLMRLSYNTDCSVMTPHRNKFNTPIDEGIHG
jgi:hypothetical protein